MAEEEKSAGSGFGKLVYGTLKGNGINTEGMSFDEAVKKFNELGGTDNWHAKIMKREAKEKEAKESGKENKEPDKVNYKKATLNDANIPNSYKDIIERQTGTKEIEMDSKDGTTYIKYTNKKGDIKEISYNEKTGAIKSLDKESNQYRTAHHIESTEEFAKEIDAEMMKNIDYVVKQYGLDKNKVLEKLKNEYNEGSNTIEGTIANQIGRSVLYTKDPSENFIKETKAKEQNPGDFESEWQRMSKAMDEDDIDTQNEALENIEKLLPFKNEEEHEKWLDLVQSYKDFNEFEEETRRIMGNKQEKPTKEGKAVKQASNEKTYKITDSDETIIGDGIYYALKENRNATADDVIKQINMDMDGFIGTKEKENAIREYLNKKGYENKKDVEEANRRMGGNNEERPFAKFDEYGIPDEETLKKRDRWLKGRNLDQDKLSKMSNEEFNSTAQKIMEDFGIEKFDLAQELLVDSGEEKQTSTKQKVEKNAKDFMDKAKKGEIKPENSAPKEFKWNENTNSYEYKGANVMKSPTMDGYYEIDYGGEEILTTDLNKAKKTIDELDAYSKKHHGYMYGEDKYI